MQCTIVREANQLVWIGYLTNFMDTCQIICPLGIITDNKTDGITEKGHEQRVIISSL